MHFITYVAELGLRQVKDSCASEVFPKLITMVDYNGFHNTTNNNNDNE
jgi:hypothetical protein